LFWTTIKPFINPVTRAKVQIINGSDQEKAQVLSKAFDMSQMEKRYGGESVWTYQHQVYWTNEVTMDTTRLKRMAEVVSTPEVAISLQ
jgi:UDP-N-acetylmuramyl pentapeptide synthase